MRKILYGLSIIVAVTAVAVGATTAFYNDTETSSGNVLAAGAIDLGIDNTSYYNGVLNPGTSWELDWDLDPATNPLELARLFFNFDDLKPGDWGEDTISLHVDDNDAWLCADVTLTSDNDNVPTEPELDVPDPNTGVGLGELADAVNFYWWADDGDNVYETCGGQAGVCVNETLLPAGPLGALSVGQTATVALADSTQNIWGYTQDGPGETLIPAPLPKNSATHYIGKAWCFGESAFQPYVQDGFGSGHNNSPVERPVVCDGSNEGNITQTDSMTVNITFRAEQARHQKNFVCSAPTQRPKVGANLSAYVATTACTDTVSGAESIQAAEDAATANNTICVDSTYDKTGDNTAIRIETVGLTLAATSQGVDLDVPVVLSADDVTVTGFDGAIGQAESPAEVAAFYLDNDATNATISYNRVVGIGSGAAILFETGATLGGGLITNNVLSGAVQGLYTNPHTGIVTIEYNDIDNNVAGIGGLMGAIVRYNEFEHTTLGSEAIGIDSTFDANVATVNFNNFLNNTEYNDYGATATPDAEDNFWSTSGVSQTTAGIDFTPEEGSAFPHN